MDRLDYVTHVNL